MCATKGNHELTSKVLGTCLLFAISGNEQPFIGNLLNEIWLALTFFCWVMLWHYQCPGCQFKIFCLNINSFIAYKRYLRGFFFLKEHFVNFTPQIFQGIRTSRLIHSECIAIIIMSKCFVLWLITFLITFRHFSLHWFMPVILCQREVIAVLGLL